MGKYAYTQSGTSPDAGQQAMTCQAQVAKQFDPPSTDDSREWAALKMLICVEFCAIAATAAPVLFGAGTAGDIAYQHVADPNKPIDFGEAGVAGIFAAITGTPEGLGTLGKLTWGLTTGSTGSSITSLLNGQGPGSSLQNQEAGFAGSVCALAKGAWGAMCTAIAGAIQGYVDNYQKQHGTGP